MKDLGLYILKIKIKIKIKKQILHFLSKVILELKDLGTWMKKIWRGGRNCLKFNANLHFFIASEKKENPPTCLLLVQNCKKKKMWM